MLDFVEYIANKTIWKCYNTFAYSTTVIGITPSTDGRKSRVVVHDRAFRGWVAFSAPPDFPPFHTRWQMVKVTDWLSKGKLPQVFAGNILKEKKILSIPNYAIKRRRAAYWRESASNRRDVRLFFSLSALDIRHGCRKVFCSFWWDHYDNLIFNNIISTNWWPPLWWGLFCCGATFVAAFFVHF